MAAATAATTTQPLPIALPNQNVPDDLQCSICFEVPFAPKLTPCEHVFCEPCIEAALSSQPTCPNCQTDCTPQQVRAIEGGTLIHRIWSGVKVECRRYGGTCSWTGSIGEYDIHVGRDCELMHLRRRVQDLEKAAADAYSRNAELHAQMEEMDGEIEDLKKDNIDLQQQANGRTSEENRGTGRSSRSLRVSKRRRVVKPRNPSYTP